MATSVSLELDELKASFGQSLDKYNNKVQKDRAYWRRQHFKQICHQMEEEDEAALQKVLLQNESLVASVADTLTYVEKLSESGHVSESLRTFLDIMGGGDAHKYQLCKAAWGVVFTSRCLQEKTFNLVRHLPPHGVWPNIAISSKRASISHHGPITSFDSCRRQRCIVTCRTG